jgi:hypothetical protein
VEALADAHLEEANTRARLDAAGVRYRTEIAPDGSRLLISDQPTEE